MKKSKIAALVLLLAMGLSPVSGGVSLADGENQQEQAQATTEENQKNNNGQSQGANSTDSKGTDNPADGKETDRSSKDGEDQPTKPEDTFDVKAYVTSKVEEITGKDSKPATKLYRISTAVEKENFDKEINAFIASHAGKTKEEVDKDIDQALAKAKEGLGQTVVYAKPLRTRIRILSKLADDLEKKKSDDALKKANDATKALVAKRDTSLKDLDTAYENLSKAVESYAKATKTKLGDLAISQADLNAITKKGGYPDDLVAEFKEADFERGFDELVLEKDAFLKDAEKYIKEDELKKVKDDKDLNEASKKIISDYETSKKALEDLKPAEDKLDALNDAINAFDNASFKLEYFLKSYMESPKTYKNEDKYEKALKDDDFRESDVFKTTSKKFKDAYTKAYDALKKEKNDANLKALEAAKKNIQENTFMDKYEALKKEIEDATSKKISKNSLEKLKKDYLAKLEKINNKDGKTLDDLNDFENNDLKKFKEKLEGKGKIPGSGTRTTVRSKKAKAKVRTGIKSILPIAGGVVVLAVVGLIFTRKKK